MAAKTIYLDRDNDKWLKEQNYTSNISSLFNRLLRNFIKHHNEIQEAESLAAAETYNELNQALNIQFEGDDDGN